MMRHRAIAHGLTHQWKEGRFVPDIEPLQFHSLVDRRLRTL